MAGDTETGVAGVPALEAALGEVAGRLRRMTAHVLAGARSAGAGVIWTADGVIVTNAHVAPGAVADVVLPDGRTVRARLLARDPRLDLAALDVATDGLAAAERRDARELRPGELLVALGHPLGVAHAAALGVVHRTPRAAPGPTGWLHADVRLAPGNSGGPIADAAGRIVGISAMVARGLGIAVPTHLIEWFLDPLLAAREGARAA